MKPKGQITQEMIDAVFSDPKLKKKFTRPRKAKAVCEARLAGNIYSDISKRYGVSNFFCTQSVYKVVRLYTVFVEG